MDDHTIISLLQEPGLYTLGVAIFILTFFTRKLVEMLVPIWKKLADANAPSLTYKTTMARWWNEVLLYALPVVMGVLISFIPMTEWLYAGATGMAKMFVGMNAGWFSGFIYKTIKRAIQSRVGVSFPDDVETLGD
jgi:hypothetical protein